MFSVMEPGTHLPAHRGPYNGLLRLHLGLLIPEPREQLGIRVERQICRWDFGRALIFDDAYEHEAWNHTGGDPRPCCLSISSKPLRFPANLLNRLLLSLAPFTPFIREGADNHGRVGREIFYGAGANAAR